MQRFSFYYRESLFLNALFPNAYKFSLLYPDDNVIIEDGVMRLKYPESLDPSSIHNIVRVYPHKYDYFKIEVNIRCWREDEFHLKEVTRCAWIKANKVFKLTRRVVNKIYPLPNNTHLFTNGGVSFFSKNNHLVRREKGKSFVIGKMPRLTDPIYYEFLPVGAEAFLRTGGLIYNSEDGMTKWKKIYDAKRAIKNSMIWIEEENALLFSEYTPGLNLCRHHLYKYYVHSGETKTIMTFFSPDEHERDGAAPYCRHIHVLMKDPFTKDIFLGVGDSDDESAIYRSSDNGNHFALVGKGDQSWRTLSFIFTERSVFWNTDSPDPQYLSEIRRDQLNDLPLQTNEVKHWPLYNSASWNTAYDGRENLVVMSASCEGTLYDNKNRVYGIQMNKDKPVTYSLFDDESKGREKVSRSHQLFVLGVDNEGYYWFYDTRKHCYRKFVLKVKK